MTSQPHHLDVDLEAKYLQKAISPRDQKPINPLTEYETDCLYRFRQAPEDDVISWRRFPQKLRKRINGHGVEWMHNQVAEQ